jgi:hypothetical protein
MVKPTRNKAYSLTTALIDVFPFPIFKTSAPTTSDVAFEIGQVWVYKNGDARTVYNFCGLTAAGDAIWQTSASGVGDIEFLQGDSGGQISPVNEEIVLAGGTNLTTVGTAGTITINLDPAISLATSVTSPLYTAPISTDLRITAATDQDVIVTLGDDQGSQIFAIRDSSAGDLIVVASDTINLTGEVTNIGITNALGTITIGAGTVGKTVRIGNGTGNHILIFGNSNTGNVTMTSGTSLTLTAPTVSVAGNLSLTTAGTSLEMNGGAATDFIGQATLVNGTVTILNTNIDNSTHKIFLQRKSPLGSSALGELIYTITTGVNFVITARRTASPGTTETGDESQIEYFIVKQN